MQDANYDSIDAWVAYTGKEDAVHQRPDGSPLHCFNTVRGSGVKKARHPRSLLVTQLKRTAPVIGRV